MSRHARYRLGDGRRPGPAARTDDAPPVRLAIPVPPRGAEPRPAAPIAPPADPGPGQEVPPVMPMAALHLPTAIAGAVDEPAGPSAGCTPAQLRRFIKSRAYLPVHEIRRRFGIGTADDDVTGFAIENGRVFVGLPQREGRILGELVRAGEVGYELQLDPEAPIIVGVYPMRPVTRQ